MLVLKNVLIGISVEFCKSKLQIKANRNILYITIGFN